jgi:hypothetical protein
MQCVYKYSGLTILSAKYFSHKEFRLPGYNGRLCHLYLTNITKRSRFRHVAVPHSAKFTLINVSLFLSSIRTSRLCIICH